MEALKYLQFKKDDVIFSARSGNYAEIEAEELFQKLLKIITTLKTQRNSQSITEETLRVVEDTGAYGVSIVQHWLLQAVEHDDSFIYAYNHLAKFVERNGSFNNYILKDVDDDKLYKLLYSEETRAEVSTEIDPFINKVPKVEKALTGFKSDLTENQIQSIFDKSIGNFIDATQNNFNAIFINKSLPEDFQKVRWIHLNGKKAPNQTSLRAFLKFAMKFETNEPDQSLIDNCFTDINGERIVLGKNKQSVYSERWGKKFRLMISS